MKSLSVVYNSLKYDLNLIKRSCTNYTQLKRRYSINHRRNMLNDPYVQ